MARTAAEKSYFTFAGGLITDVSPLGYPDETTQDESNFELLRNGSRRRRKGLLLESGGANYTLPDTLTSTDRVTSFNWRDAGGVGSNFIAVQFGCNLVFFSDTKNPSSSIQSGHIDLCAYKVSGKANSDVANNPISMTVGVGKNLIVAGKYIEPFYITWDGSDFTANPISIIERDFIGNPDDVPMGTYPTSSTLDISHEYNLRNRGWRYPNITQYHTDKSKWPSKAMWPWKAFRRRSINNINADDGTWEFSSDKIEAELFGDASAPQGHLLINPFNTTTSGIVSGVNQITDLTWTSSTVLQVTTQDAHGFSNGNNITIVGNTFFYSDPMWPIYYNSTIDGTYTISGVTTNTFTIAITQDPYFSGWGTLGQTHSATTSEIVNHPNPFTTSERPQIVAWYAGRVWYFNIDDEHLADKIYFSQIAEFETQYGKCYQHADPTDQEFNELTPADGGVIIIPDLGKVHAARVFGNSLLIFSLRGVWSISGNRGGFSADSYEVRKISDYSCTSEYAIVSTSDKVFWSGWEGINILFQDPQTGFLTAEPILLGKNQTWWNRIPEVCQERVKLTYDKGQDKLYVLYNTNSSDASNKYNECFVYFAPLKAAYLLTFPKTSSYITHILTTTTTQDSELNKNIKFIVAASSGTIVKMCDMAQTSFLDFDGTESVPYMVSGYDNLKDFHNQKQAPVIHTFCQKTETGYTEAGTDLIPINESSVLLRPIWDWSDNTNSGKYGPQYQVYRHRRYYQPANSSDTFDDGQPVVVARSKLRGRGRVLHLEFEGEAGKDAHILGWTILYTSTR